VMLVVRRWPSHSRSADVSAVVDDPSSFLPAMSVADGDWLGR
jgi:hypothetical protein